jgi:hypothetical protein
MLSETAARLRSAPKRSRGLRLLLRLDRRCKLLFSRTFVSFQPGWLLLAVGLLAFVSLIPPIGRDMPRHDGNDWPVAAVDYIEREDLRGRFFAAPDFGSYLTWRMPDRARTYVDTRGFFFPPQLLEDSNFLPQLTPGWPERLDRVLALGTDYFLLETTRARGEMWRAFQPYLDTPLFLDELCVLVTAEQVRIAAERFRKYEVGDHSPLAKAPSFP